MRVFDREIPEESKSYFSVEAGSYANTAAICLPVIVLRGAQEGPVFWINGEVHGEELNGSIATWEFLRELSPSQVRGTVIATPIANPLALSDRNKISVIDYLDMDTAFPGSESGTWTQRIAKILFDEIRQKANAVLSFHTLAPRHLAKPYTVSKIVPGVGEEIWRASRTLALTFGVEANCSVDLSTASGELPGVTSGALDIMCMKEGIPCFMAEMGCGSSIERPSIETAKQGIQNVMAKLGMLEKEIAPPPPQILITKRKFLRADKGGFLRERILSPGDYVKKGDVIAQTHFFGGELETYRAAEDLYVIAARKHPVIHTGERFVFVGTQWTPVGPEDR